MECNEVFSVSHSAIFGQRRGGGGAEGRAGSASNGTTPGTGDSATSGVQQDELWNSPPVNSLRSAAVASGKRSKTSKAANLKRAGSIDTPYYLGAGHKSVNGENGNSLSPTGIAVLQVTDVTTGKTLVVNEETSPREHEMDSSLSSGSSSRARRWFELCHCRRELLAIKLFYFAFIGSLGVVLTYVAVFLKQHGLSAFEIGIISGIRPVIGFLSAPAWGALGDRYGIRKYLMLFSMMAWLAFFVGLYYVDQPQIRDCCPPLDPFIDRLSARHVRIASTEAVFGLVTPSPAASQATPTVDSVQGISLNGTFSTIASSTSVFSNSSKTSTPYPFAVNSSTVPTTANCNETVNATVSGHNQALLREDLDWLYEPSSRYSVFIICLVIICAGELFQAPTTAMSDAATLQILGRDQLDQYGAQRAWGPVGWAISSLVTGSVLDSLHWNFTKCGVDLSFTDYRCVSYIFIPSFILGLIAALKINFGSKPKDKEKMADASSDIATKSSATSGEESGSAHSTMAVIRVFLNVRNGSWILTTFFVGVCNGLIWGFLFWHLDNLGGSKLLMGIDAVVVCLFEFGAFFVVDYVIKLIGHMGVMYIGLLGYSIRFVVYASISNPWTVLPVEVLQGVTFSFIWVSLSQYTAVAVPSISLGTVQGIIHGVYFGLGNGIGHLVGGVMIDYFGAVITFYTFSAASALWLVLFFICQKFSKKPVDQFAYQDMNAADDVTSTTENGSECLR